MSTKQPPKATPDDAGNTLRRWFIDPLNMANEADYQNARALATILLLVLVLVFPIVFVFRTATTIEPALVENVTRVAPLGGLALGLGYAIARLGYYRVALWQSIISISLVVYLAAVPAGGYLSVLYYLLVPVFIASLFLSVRSFVVVALLNLLAIALMPALFANIAPGDVISGPLSVIGLISLILTLAMTMVRSGFVDRSADFGGEQMRFTRLLNFNPNMVAIYADGRFVYINPAGVRLLGAEDEDQIIGQPVTNFMPQEATQLVRVQHKDEHAIHTGEHFKRLDGSLLEVEVTSMPVIYQGQLATQIIVQNFTDLRRVASSLLESEERYLTISELISDYAYRVDIDNNERRFAWIDGQYEVLTGFLPEDALDWDEPTHLAHPQDRPILRQHWDAIQRGEMHISEFRLNTRHEQPRWVRDYGRPVWSVAENRIIGITSVVQDVTERLQAEATMKAHALQQAVVAELGQRILSQEANDELIMQEAVILAAQVLDVEFIRLYLLEGEHLKPVAVYGWQEDLPVQPINQRPTAGQAAYTFNLKATVIIKQMGTERRFKITPEMQDITSGAGVLLQGEGPLGVLEAHTSTPREFDLDDTNFLQSIANVLAAFIEQNRTRQAERDQRTIAEVLVNLAGVLNSSLELDEVLSRILSQLSRVVPYDAASIMLVEGDEARLIRQIGFDAHGVPEAKLQETRIPVVPNPMLQSMIQTRQPVIVPDVREEPGWYWVPGTEWIRSYIGTPIFYSDDLLGIINVDSTETNAFDENDAKRLQAFANQASIAIRNARRATELEANVIQRTQDLERERRRLQTILDSTGEGIFYIQGDHIRYANKAFCQMTGYTTEELDGTHYDILLPEELRQDQSMWNEVYGVVNRGEVWRSEIRLSRRDGTEFDAGLTVSVADSAEDSPLTIVLVRDISRAKELEAQKSRFIATASHELRSPISSLNTRLYMMRRNPDDMPHHLDLLQRVINSMNGLVEDLLDLSRFENGVIHLRQRAIILQTLINDIIEIQGAELENQQITLLQEIDPNPMPAFVDPERMTQVLTNIIVNAGKFTHQGGTVTLRLQREGEQALIQIEDTGIGICPEDLPHIFDPFFQGESGVKGTGLGLSIAREIVKLHGGSIDAASTLGEGSTFYIRLPLLED